MGRPGRFGTTENFCNFAKVSFFETGIFMFSLAKETTKLQFLHISVRIKKLINIKVGKISIFALKFIVLGQNRLII